jgi:hypothetical protein
MTTSFTGWFGQCRLGGQGNGKRRVSSQCWRPDRYVEHDAREIPLATAPGFAMTDSWGGIRGPEKMSIPRGARLNATCGWLTESEVAPF